MRREIYGHLDPIEEWAERHPLFFAMSVAFGSVALVRIICELLLLVNGGA